MGDPRPGDLGGGRGHRADLRDVLGRAGALGAAGLRGGAGVRRDRRARGDGHRADRRAARPAPGAAHRRLRPQGPRRTGRGGRRGGAGRADRASGRAARPGSGHPDLHLGHHRAAQGLPADPFQPALRDPRRQGEPADAARRGTAAADLFAAGPRAGPLADPVRVRQQGDRGIHQRHQEPAADVRRVQADRGGVGAAGVREGLQHRRAKRRQRRQGPHLRDGRADRRRLERGGRPRPAGSAAAGQARVVRPAGVPQAAGGAGRRLPRVRVGGAHRWARGSGTSSAAWA